MKHLLLICLSLLISNQSEAQLTFSTGATPYSLFLLPFTPICIGNGSTSATASTITGTFQFNGVQCCACPSSGQIDAPGTVSYGGTGSSASFTYYHTLSYSSSNEHQQLQFSSPVNVFQFSTSGQAGAADQMSVQVYNGATLLGTFNFMTAGPGSYNTFNIVHTGAGFTRVAFVEIGSVSADDELLGDFFINDVLIALSSNSLNFNAAIEESYSSDALLSWNGMLDENITSFELSESTDGATWEMINHQLANNPSNNYNYSRSIRANVTYYYRLEAYNENNELIQAQTRILKKLNYEQMVFPNPAKDGFYITRNGDYINEPVVIVDMLGKEIELRTENSNYYSTSNLSNGIYVIKGMNEKIVVQH